MVELGTKGDILQCFSTPITTEDYMHQPPTYMVARHKINKSKIWERILVTSHHDVAESKDVEATGKIYTYVVNKM